MIYIKNHKTIVPLHPSNKAETGSGGDQPVRNNLTCTNCREKGLSSLQSFL